MCFILQQTTSPTPQSEALPELRLDTIIEQTQSAQTQSHHGIPTRQREQRKPSSCTHQKNLLVLAKRAWGATSDLSQQNSPPRGQIINKPKVINGCSCYLQSTIESDAHIPSQIWWGIGCFSKNPSLDNFGGCFLSTLLILCKRSPLCNVKWQSQEAAEDAGVQLGVGSSCPFVRFADLGLAGRGHLSAVVVGRMQDFVRGSPIWEWKSGLPPDSRSCLADTLQFFSACIQFWYKAVVSFASWEPFDGNGRREGTWARTLFLDKIWPEFEFLSKSLESSRLLLSRRHHPFTWTWDMNGWMSPASLTFHTDPFMVGTSSMGTHWAISYRMKPQSRVFHQRLPVWTGWQRWNQVIVPPASPKHQCGDNHISFVFSTKWPKKIN